MHTHYRPMQPVPACARQLSLCHTLNTAVCPQVAVHFNIWQQASLSVWARLTPRNSTVDCTTGQDRQHVAHVASLLAQGLLLLLLRLHAPDDSMLPPHTHTPGCLCHKAHQPINPSRRCVSCRFVPASPASPAHTYQTSTPPNARRVTGRIDHVRVDTSDVPTRQAPRCCCCC